MVRAVAHKHANMTVKTLERKFPQAFDRKQLNNHPSRTQDRHNRRNFPRNHKKQDGHSVLPLYRNRLPSPLNHQKSL